MTDFTTVQLEKDPRGFATLWLNRAEKNNAFNAEMIRELILALAAVSTDKTLRFLLLRGRGKHFSAGADLAWMQHSATLDYNANLAESHELAELMYSLHSLAIPTLPALKRGESIELSFDFDNPETRKAFSFHLLGEGRGAIRISDFSVVTEPLPPELVAAQAPETTLDAAAH